MTLTREMYDSAPEVVDTRIGMDFYSNPDGAAVLLVDRAGNHSLIRTMDVMLVIGALHALPWARAFVHCRLATQGSTSIGNTHGWTSRDGVVYMHNGILQAPAAATLPVDSMLIGQWLDEGGLPLAVANLANESFANTFLIDVPMGLYAVVRTSVGSLFTDGNNNFSSHRIAELGVTEPVPAGQINYAQLPMIPPKLFAVGS